MLVLDVAHSSFYSIADILAVVFLVHDPGDIRRYLTVLYTAQRRMRVTMLSMQVMNGE